MTPVRRTVSTGPCIRPSHLCRLQPWVAGLDREPVDVADGTVELAVTGAHGLARIVEPHAYGSDFSGYIQRGEQIVICLVLRVAKLPHLVIVELHVLVAQPEADVEAAEPLRDLDERRYVALVNPVVGIRNLGDIGREEIGGARIGVFLAELNLSSPQRMAHHQFLGEHPVSVG